MKKRIGRVLTEKDMEGSEHKSSCMSELDKLVEVCRVALELYDQQVHNNVTVFDIRCSVDKSWGKRHVRSDQERNRTALFSSTTCRISSEELFKEGCKKSRGETSSSSYCYYEYGNVRRSWSGLDDHVVNEKVLGKKRKCYDSKDGDFVYGYQVVNEKVLGKKRKCYDLKDQDFEYSEKKEKKARNNVNVRNNVVETAPLPVEFANEIQRLGGTDVKLLIQKTLSATDLNTCEN